MNNINNESKDLSNLFAKNKYIHVSAEIPKNKCKWSNHS